jgi:pantoate--beta-alanine ligase
MTRDLNLPVEIVVGATQREPDGLALSSRNVYLAPAERQAAAILYRALCAARDAFQRGERDGENLCATMRATLQTEPRAEVEYVSAADPRTLQELNAFQGEVLLSMAVRIGATRLIDNFLLRE